MFEERRRHRRFTINRIAKFQADSGALPRDCMITDISKQGARLFADGVEVPDQFHLLISGEGDKRQPPGVPGGLAAGRRDRRHLRRAGAPDATGVEPIIRIAAIMPAE